MSHRPTLELQQPIGTLMGVGPKTAAVFSQHGLRTIEDLLYFFPRAWIDASQITPLEQARVNRSILCDVRVAGLKTGISQKNRLPYIRATLADATGTIEAMWFRQSYLKTKLTTGSRHLLYGKVHGWRAGERLFISPKFLISPQIMSVYPQIGGLTSEKIRRAIATVLPLADTIRDHLGLSLCRELSVISLSAALKHIHCPLTMTDIAAAKDRLGLEELMMIVLPGELARQARAGETTWPLPVAPAMIAQWHEALPFKLTDGQRTAAKEILADLACDRPMNRLLQGDVGSGKTVVALTAALAAVLAGRQVVWLAPTELLADQHFATVAKLLAHSPVGALSRPIVRLALWTSARKVAGEVFFLNGKKTARYKEKRITIDELAAGDIIVGTHALLHHHVSVPSLGLLIIDEQHRFGVSQRARLRHLSIRPVHLLSMTATPIPRTMALTLDGDLALSTIRDKPLGRKTITTRVVEARHSDKAYAFMEQHMAAGRQIYVVCPLIEPSSDAEATVFASLFQPVEEREAVTTRRQQLQRLFPNRRIGLLHGKMKSADKAQAMADFRAGRLDMLVCTPVIEVGVDVPQATIMAIESAERFGLATLHQLRGRVGRSPRQSFCLLFPSSDAKAENARLRLLESTDDGFALAEKDLRLRGPGELTGLAQSGLPKLKFATFDDLVKAEKIKVVLPALVKIPHFRQAVERFWRQYHPE